MSSVERNSTSFPIWNYERLKGKKWAENDLEMYHQFLVRNYLLENPKQRGLLAYHQTGTGKTRLGANNIKEYANDRQIVVIAPKKVFGTFAREFEVVGVDKSNVNFISLKANNLTEQIDRLPGGPEGGGSVEDVWGVEGGADVLKNTPLNNTFLVIDEAHNFFNAIVNGSQNAVNLYDSVMAAQNIKILCLTGTPINNHPFELAPCFNMLDGSRLFPENLEDFEKFFISKDSQHVQNADKFKNRIFGLVSYYGDWVQATMRAHRPKRLPTKVIQVPMSEKQYAVYSGYRDKEREERGSMGRNSNQRFAPKNSSSTYRIRSRQSCNFVPDPKAEHRGVDDPTRCPKFHAALEIVERHPNQPGIVCSNFVNDCGLRDFASLLRLRGWEEWDGSTTRKNSKRYAIVAGDVDEDVVSKLQHTASTVDNVRAGIIRLVLIGPAGAEGIEFKHFRYNIIMDPFFNAVRLDQFEARIDRYKSHETLPKDEQTVQPYHLLAAYPKNVDEKERAREPTTDNDLYIQSKRRKLLSLEFYRILIEASMDCPIHRDSLPRDRASKIHCMMCAPTNKALFTSRLDKDCIAANPCQTPRVEKIEAKEIVVETPSGAKKYMYTRKGEQFEFFEFRDDLGGYVPVARNHKEYDLLIETVGKK